MKAFRRRDHPKYVARLGVKRSKLTTEENVAPFFAIYLMSLAITVNRHHIGTSWESDLDPVIASGDGIERAEISIGDFDLALRLWVKVRVLACQIHH